MLHRPSIQNLAAALGVAVAIALTGCGASPTAPTTHLTARRVTAAASALTRSAVAAKPIAPASLARPAAAKPAAPVATARVAAPAAPAPATQTEAALPVDTESKSVSIESTGGADSSAAASDSAATSTPVVDSVLTADVTSQKNGLLFGMGSFKCTVTVSNPSDHEQTGVLTVTFMNGANPSKTAPVVQLVDIQPGSTQSFDFSDPKWSTDSVVAQVADTHAGQPMAAYVTAKKNGVFLGLGSYKCTVTVINPDDQPHTGILLVTFKKGSKDSATDPYTETITLQPRTSKTIELKDPKWTTNDVVATIE